MSGDRISLKELRAQLAEAIDEAYELASDDTSAAVFYAMVRVKEAYAALAVPTDETCIRDANEVCGDSVYCRENGCQV